MVAAMDDDAIARHWDSSGEAVAARMRGVRNGAALSQTEFGDRLGVKKASVQAWENARARPTYEHLAALKRHFRIETDFIVTGAWDELPERVWRPIREAMIADATPVADR